MKRKLVLTVCAAAAFMMSSAAAVGGESVIAGVHGNGTLTWSDSEYQGSDYRVEWASSPDGIWSDDWSSLSSMEMTNAQATVEIPMFFRIVRVGGDLLSGKYLEQQIDKNEEILMSFYELNFISTNQYTQTSALDPGMADNYNYAEVGDNAFTTSEGRGIVSKDGSVFSIVDTSYEPSWQVGVKSSTDADLSLLNGGYGIFSYQVAGQNTGGTWVESMEFDGAGGLAISEPGEDEAQTTTYAVATNGVFQYTGPIGERMGMVSKDGKLFTYQDHDIENALTTMSVGIKSGTGMSNSNLVGTYIVNIIGAGFYSMTQQYYMIFDGEGGVSSLLLSHSGGPGNSSIFGNTYEVSDNGWMTVGGLPWGGISSGMVSEDGSIFAGNYGDDVLTPGDIMGLVIGIRESMSTSDR